MPASNAAIQPGPMPSSLGKRVVPSGATAAAAAAAGQLGKRVAVGEAYTRRGAVTYPPRQYYGTAGVDTDHYGYQLEPDYVAQMSVYAAMYAEEKE